MTRILNVMRAATKDSPGRQRSIRLGVAMVLLWPASILLVAGGAASSLNCSRAAEQCVVIDRFLGLAIRREVYPAREFTSAFIQGRSIGRARGNGTDPAYFLELAAPSGRTYSSAAMYDSAHDAELVLQQREAEAFIQGQRAAFSDGPRYAWSLLAPGLILLGATVWLIYWHYRVSRERLAP